MDALKHNSQQPTGDGEVHQLESRRSAAETYKAFYDLYGQETFYDDISNRISTQLLIGGRALHFDDTNDASTHLIVREFDGVLQSPSMRKGPRGSEYHFFPYNSDAFFVATTDGDTIDRWHVNFAYATHPGKLGHIPDPWRGIELYDEQKLDMYLNLTDPHDHGDWELRFNRGTVKGTMSLVGQRLGWIILSERDTERQNERLQEASADIGHIATAS